jgi:hypothetical protein
LAAKTGARCPAGVWAGGVTARASRAIGVYSATIPGGKLRLKNASSKKLPWGCTNRGLGVGMAVGCSDGMAVGCSDGMAVGCSDGMAVGCSDGMAVGCSDGMAVGCSDGTSLGTSLGAWLGTSVHVCMYLSARLSVCVCVCVYVCCPLSLSLSFYLYINIHISYVVIYPSINLSRYRSGLGSARLYV